MKIGIIGIGVVGAACKFGFELLGHELFEHDIRLDTSIDGVLNTDVVFICVPSPSTEDGACDVSIVEEVVLQLKNKNYSGAVAIKSTVEPGTTQRLIDETKMNICFVPEFLRERCAVTDFTENHDVCIVGTNNLETYDLLKKCHGNYPEKFVNLTPTEAEFCKYFNNIYNAMLIIFANSFYEACKNKDVNYTNVKNAIINRKHIHGNYLECNDNFRGFGGMCLPKDVSALAAMMKDTNIEFFKNLLEENKKYKITVFEGMRR